MKVSRVFIAMVLVEILLTSASAYIIVKFVVPWVVAFLKANGVKGL